MKAVVTICSRHKDESAALLPARKRYTGEHIRKAEKIAEERSLPLFILSGKFGLIPADREIPNYDQYLEDAAADGLVPLVADQIREYGITEIEFYTEGRDDWAPYERTLQKAGEIAGVKIQGMHTDPHSDATSGYHLFIEPEGSLAEELQQAIDALADSCGGPSFVPHVTLLAEIPEEDEREVIRKATQLAGMLQPFEISLGEEGMEDAYFRALYLRAGGEGIAAAHAKANELFGMQDDAYMPHLSLLYGNYPEERKRAAFAALPAAPGTAFLADSVSLWHTPGGVLTWKKIATLPFGTDGRR